MLFRTPILIKQHDINNFKFMDQESLPSLYEPSTWLAYTALGTLVGLSQAGGIGGGPIISPVMMVLLGLPSKKAIWNTYVMLLGGSLGNFLRLGKERTPSGNAPLINYQLVMITLPLLLSGAIFGVATGKWLPKIAVVVFLFIILTSVFLRTLSLYRKLREKENNACSAEQHLLPMQELKTLAATEDCGSPKTAFELQQILQKEQRLYPLEYIQELALQVVIILFITVIKGSSTIPSLLGVQYCTITYHCFNLSILGIAFYNVKRYQKIIRKDETKKAQCGFSFADGKMTAVFDQTVKSSLMAGFLGGLVGLGGGVVLTPLWLGMGIQSARATASATFSVFFTATISVFIIAMSGGYTFDEFIILGVLIFHDVQGVSATGSYLVAGMLKAIVRKYKRESILIQVLLGVISFGLLILPFQSIKDVYHDPAAAVAFGRFC